MKEQLLFFLLLATPSVQAAELPDLFRDGFDPGAEVDFDISNISKCKHLDEATVTCVNAFSKVLGVKPQVSKMETKRNKITRFYFSADHSEFMKISKVITGQFGSPSKAKTSRLNGDLLKRPLTSLQQSWKLSEGSLTITERSYLSDNFTFQYRRN